jgi:hypothetical protein
MTLEQVKAEVERCDSYIATRVVRMVNENRRYCIKNNTTGKKFFKRVDFKHNGLNFHFTPYTEGKSHFKKHGLNFFSFVTFIMNGRLWAATIRPNEKRVITVTEFYTPHFFDRYIERNGVDEETIVEVIDKFQKRNVFDHWDDYEKEGYENNVMITMEEGTAFGTKCEGYLRFNTFVRHDMLFNDQRNMHKVGLMAIENMKRHAV